MNSSPAHMENNSLQNIRNKHANQQHLKNYKKPNNSVFAAAQVCDAWKQRDL